MSETIEEGLQPQPEPAPQETVQAPETPPPEPSPEERQQREHAREQRRIARLTERTAALSRERDQLAQRLAQLEQAQSGYNNQQQPQPQLTPELRQYAMQQVQLEEQQRQRDDQMRAFHEAAYETYPDWDKRRAALQAMGADPQIAEMLVQMKDGHKVAGALYEQPEELDRIAEIRTPQGRAIALGQFAAKLEATAARAVSRAPRPPATVDARATGEFNPYVETDPDRMVDYFMKQVIDKQLAAQREQRRR